MIDKQHGKFVVECDSCDETLETDYDDFSEAVRHMRREGWGTERVGAMWIHACPKHA